jgi:hypothetical protein
MAIWHQSKLLKMLRQRQMPVTIPTRTRAHAVWGINSWCWNMFMVYVGTRLLDFTDKWLRYLRVASFHFVLSTSG